MTLEEQIQWLNRVHLTKSPLLYLGRFIGSRRFAGWSADEQYLYVERVAIIDGAGPKISAAAHATACNQIEKPTYESVI